MALQDDLPAASEEEPEHPLPVIELDALLARPPSRRKRFWQALLVLAALAVALAALRNTLLPPGEATSQSMPQISVTVWSNVNFGKLTVNGQTLDKPPPLTMLLPARGATTITISAPPFRPHTCRFTNLTAPQDDAVHCLFSYDGTGPTPTPTTGGTPPSGFTAGVSLLPDDLPPGQQRQALAAMSQPLNAPEQTIAHPGEYIATSYRYPTAIISQRAATSLVARAIFEPGKIPGPPGGPSCGAGICPWGGFPAWDTAPHPRSWNLFFTEALRWQISDPADGIVQADVSIPTTDIVGMRLTEDSQAGWKIAYITAILHSVSDTTCQTGADLLHATLGGADVTALRDLGVEGCELHAQDNGAEEGRYVWRFGVLLTADAEAQAKAPDLPAAPAAEIAAVGG